MDVRCGRCGTEYEFDDALVSERGTTVKCTNCGYQFKIHASGPTGAPERWFVRTTSGRELVYTSLRDLQKGIAQRQVGPDDLLSRGNDAPRALGSIAELEPFFSTRAQPQRTKSTLAGVAPPANPTQVDAERPGLGGTLNMAGGQKLGGTLAMEPIATKPSPDVTPPPRAPMATEPISLLNERQQAQAPDDAPAHEPEPPTIPRNARPLPDAQIATTQLSPGAPKAPEPTPTPTPGEIRDDYRRAIESHSDARYPSHPPPSRSVTPRWIAALVLIGVTALIALTVGRKYILRFVQPPNGAVQSSDARVAELIGQSNQLLEEGDLEGAREHLDKASALADSDPAVLAALARLETIRADLVWLKLRLLDPQDKPLVQATHRQLGQRVGRAKQATEKAAATAASDPVVVRARIDVLRLSGELEQARELIGPIAEDQAIPENAYLLAALDMAETQPGWVAIVERLRTAASGNRDVGRARVALVYALARADRLSEAESELAKLESKAAAHPLLPDLKEFIARFSAAAADAGTDAATELATVDPTTLPVLDTSPGSGEINEPVSGNLRTNLTQAGAAIKRGDLDRAEQLYNAVLAKDPKNTEALAGLGDIAKLKRDPKKAAEMYGKVLETNPSYLPALMASADQKWDSGDKAGAVALYKRVLEQAGAGSSYGQKAAARIAAANDTSSQEPKEVPSETPKPPSEPAETPKPPPPDEDEQPHIDTTDLPEFNQ